MTMQTSLRNCYLQAATLYALGHYKLTSLKLGFSDSHSNLLRVRKRKLRKVHTDIVTYIGMVLLIS
jgi:hypothetical protein